MKHHAGEKKMKTASIRRNSKVRPAKSPRTTESAIPVDKLDRIARLIEEDIVAGKMQPGQRLDERALAERFGVSRTPIREVLVRLSSLGVVELRRNQGAFVAEMSSAKLIGMLEVMAEVKILAARLASRRMTTEERERLLAIRDETAACVDTDDLGCYFERATALHDAIYEGSHNAFLLDLARNITVCLCAYRKHLSNALHLPIVTSFEENKNVVDAIVRGDSAEAEKWMRQHTELRREELADLITAISAPTRRAA